MGDHVLNDGATRAEVGAAHLGIAALTGALPAGSLERAALDALARNLAEGLKA